MAAGYLAAGAMRLGALTGARTLPAAHIALVTAAGRWTLLAAALTGTTALGVACANGCRLDGEPDHVTGGAPVPSAGAIPDRG